jgi:hypothetical protein
MIVDVKHNDLYAKLHLKYNSKFHFSKNCMALTSDARTFQRRPFRKVKRLLPQGYQLVIEG